MNIATIFLVYAMCWWLVFFASLPLGVKSQHESEDGVTMGTVSSAPVNPNLKAKAIWSSVIAAALTIIYYLVATSGWIQLDPTR